MYRTFLRMDGSRSPPQRPSWAPLRADKRTLSLNSGAEDWRVPVSPRRVPRPSRTRLPHEIPSQRPAAIMSGDVDGARDARMSYAERRAAVWRPCAPRNCGSTSKASSTRRKCSTAPSRRRPCARRKESRCTLIVMDSAARSARPLPPRSCRAKSASGSPATRDLQPERAHRSTVRPRIRGFAQVGRCQPAVDSSGPARSRLAQEAALWLRAR